MNAPRKNVYIRHLINMYVFLTKCDFIDKFKWLIPRLFQKYIDLTSGRE